MKVFFAVCASFVVVCVAVFVLFVLSSRATTEASLLAGQTVRVANNQFKTIKVRAQYPVTIREGNCTIPRTVDVRLSCPPADLLITDARPPLLVWAQANHVTVTASAF